MEKEFKTNFESLIHKTGKNTLLQKNCDILDNVPDRSQSGENILLSKDNEKLSKIYRSAI